MIAALRRRSRQVDRAGNRALERGYPLLLQARPLLVKMRPLLARARGGGRQAVALLWLWLRPLLAFSFRALGWGERALRRAGRAAARAATAASSVVTPGRAAGALLVAAAACLLASQFVDYRAVEIGQPGYAGLPDVARPPTVAARSAGAAHAYALVPLALAAMGLGAAAIFRDRCRLGLWVAAMGLVSLAVVLLVDRPAGLDAGAQASRFAGASAVLEDGFYGELAAAGGMVLAGLLYYARPCRIRISSSGRAASARRRRPRRRASSRARVARSA